MLAGREGGELQCRCWDGNVRRWMSVLEFASLVRKAVTERR